MLPSYIDERIRQTPPEDSFVVPESTPVVCFGNALDADTATLGLNPSNREFLDGKRLLNGPSRRLSTLRSLGMSSLEEAPSAAVEQVFRDCKDYFERNPYRWWFDQLVV